MSKLKISKNLFLDSNELNRLMKFIFDDGINQIFKSIVSNYGIVGTDDFLCSLTSGPAPYIYVKILSGLAYNQNLEAIKSEEITLTLDRIADSTRWITISYKQDSREEGTVNIGNDGVLTGINTKFTEVLRSQPNFPVKIKFPDSVLNTEEYEVISLTDDNSAIISGVLNSESGAKYSIVGAFTPGFIPEESNKFIYLYDSCEFNVITSDTEPELEEGQFLILKIAQGALGNITTFEDLRSEFFSDVNKGQKPDVSLNSIASLVDAKKVGDSLLELVIEHGYNIISSSSSYNSTNSTLTISDGNCNFLGSGDIPNDFFKGWVLLNRNNMKTLKVSSNSNKTLYLTGRTSEFYDGALDVVIIPDSQEMEYLLTFSGADTRVPMIFKFSMQTTKNRFLVPIKSGATTINVKQRMIKNLDFQTKFENLCSANFNNYNSETELLTSSQFIINI